MKNNSIIKLSNHDLHTETLAAAVTEKLATLALLEFLAEADRRKLHAERGYASLWEYTVKALGYSEAQASDRVNAMRLMVRVPEVAAGLKSGNLSLTTSAKLASHARREKLTREQTVVLLPKITGKPAREVEQILQAAAQGPEGPKLTKIVLDVDADFLAMLGRLKELNGNPAASPEDLFATAMREFIKRREVKPHDKSSVTTTATEVRPVKTSETTPTRYIPVLVRNEVRRRSGDRCEFIDRLTGRRCECRIGLEFDHYPIPYAMGGAQSVENMRHVCRTHNQLQAIRSYGTEKMSQYF